MKTNDLLKDTLRHPIRILAVAILAIGGTFAYFSWKCLIHGFLIARIWMHFVAPNFDLPDLGLWAAGGLYLIGRILSWRRPKDVDPFSLGDNDLVKEFRDMGAGMVIDVTRLILLSVFVETLSHLV